MGEGNYKKSADSSRAYIGESGQNKQVRPDISLFEELNERKWIKIIPSFDIIRDCSTQKIVNMFVLITLGYIGHSIAQAGNSFRWLNLIGDLGIGLMIVVYGITALLLSAEKKQDVKTNKKNENPSSQP